MLYHTINLPVTDLRNKPTRDSEVISQAFFSEHVLVKKKAGEYLLIVTLDGYSGWVPSSSLIQRRTPYLSKGKVTQILSRLYAKPEESDPILMLPYGARLNILEKSDHRWLKVELPDGRQAFIQRGDLSKEPRGLIRFSRRFLGLPYIWGGRSSFGFDCSGFVQMVYHWKGVQLPRDSWQQFIDKRGKGVEFLHLKTGDLIFWGRTSKKIQHVGIYLEKGEFIHTSTRESKPFLRVSKLKDKEWCGNEKNHYPFRAARRFF